MRWNTYLRQKKKIFNDEESLKLSPGPLSYIQQENLLEKSGFYCKSVGEAALVIMDNNLFKKFYKVLNKSLKENRIRAEYFIFSGECCIEEVNKIVNKARKDKVNFVIGCGGGKVLDTTKIAGHELNLPCVMIATSASTCAAWTNIAVVYSKEGIYKEIITFKNASCLTLVDLSVIKDAPRELLLSGIGDSFAKYYEAKLVFNSDMVGKDTLSEVGISIAEKMYEVLKCKNVSNFKEIVTVNIVLSGMVSTIGKDACGALFAHAFVNATSCLVNLRKILHGYLAALGVVFTFNFLNKEFPDVSRYKELGLPLSFKDININLNDKELKRLAGLIIEDEAVKYYLNNDKYLSILSPAEIQSRIFQALHSHCI